MLGIKRLTSASEASGRNLDSAMCSGNLSGTFRSFTYNVTISTTQISPVFSRRTLSDVVEICQVTSTVAIFTATFFASPTVLAFEPSTSGNSSTHGACSATPTST
jgi:hypothetical protein